MGARLQAPDTCSFVPLDFTYRILFKDKLLRILRRQLQNIIPQAQGSSECGVQCTCIGHLPEKPTLRLIPVLAQMRAVYLNS